ncbi:MAG TPA: tRNA (guanine(10)-N(2))-dimethyltransferase, partial [Methanomicrobiales archaeon]|nr:tRNA (guanine(10)-N(2))-dimethyltransferase [Methanomicrobiales archaeon]
MDLALVTEGETGFFVPAQDASLQFPPGSGAVFYNPRMEVNRDTTVLLLSALRPRDYLDAMGATGARGLRVARECSIPVTINDHNPLATALIRQNATHANLPVE